jgi:CPA1 family monovalent cation:H+ antiporter
MLPDVPLAICFALGAVVAPPDAIAATAVARRIGLSRRVVTILEGESLLNDATALVLFRVATAAAIGAASDRSRSPAR